MNKFVKIRCLKCNNEQVLFTKASSKVFCLVCEELLSEPSGGRCNIKAKVLGDLN